MKSTAPHSAPFLIPSLDGLRAVSFLLVFLGHAWLSWVPAGFGVTVFFFLSGYLITTLLRQEQERYGYVDLKLFYLRRVWRIWPPFYLVLGAGLVLVLTGVVREWIDPVSVLAQAGHVWNLRLIYTGTWQGVVPGSGVYWSLAVEEHFYLLFPALYIACTRRNLSGRAQRNLFWLICAVILVWRSYLVYACDATLSRTFVGTDTRLDSILLGCALAVYQNPALDVVPTARPRFSEVLSLVVAVAVLTFTFVYRDDDFREAIRYTVQGIALYPVFDLAIRFPNWLPFRVLNLRPVRFMGTMSYSAYLTHYTIIDLVGAHFPHWGYPARTLCSLLACLGVSYCMWRFVEEPCAEVRRKLKRSPPRRAVVVASSGP